MKQIIVRKPGGLDALEIVEVNRPSIAPHEVLVEVEASGVNFADLIVREGYYKAAEGRYPIVPGFEFSGTISELGAEVKDYDVGDRIFGYTLFGGYATTIAVPARNVRRAPSNWSSSDLAGIPAAHLTAYHALNNVARVRSAETVLIFSAGGGVGLALVQQAKNLGCNVIGVVGSDHKRAAVASAGADRIYISDAQLWPDLDRDFPEGFDVVYDPNGISTPRPSFKRLRKGGRLVFYGFGEVLPRGRRPFLPLLAFNVARIPRFSPFELTSKNLSLCGLNLAFLEERIDLSQIAMDAICSDITGGKIRPVPVTEFKFDDVREAHRALGSGTTVGKIILRP